MTSVRKGTLMVDTKSRIWRSWCMFIVAAFLACFSGFGVLSAFWLLAKHDPALPGLYHYAAATWGDGLFLSMGAGALIGWFTLCEPIDTHEKRGAIAVASASGLLGMAVQASWLARNDTALNWTIPEPHRFNAAGWYHAAFFVAAFAFFFGAIWLFWRVSRRRRPPDGVARTFEVLFWAALSGYSQLHMLDDHATLLISPWRSAVTAAAVLLAAALFYRRAHESSCAAGIALAIPGTLLGMGVSLAVDPAYAMSGEIVFLCLGLVLIGMAMLLVDSTGRRSLGAEALALAISNLGIALTLACTPQVEGMLERLPWAAGDMCVLGLFVSAVCSSVWSSGRRQAPFNPSKKSPYEPVRHQMGRVTAACGALLCFLIVAGTAPADLDGLDELVFATTLFGSFATKMRWDVRFVHSQEKCGSEIDSGRIRTTVYSLIPVEGAGFTIFAAFFLMNVKPGSLRGSLNINVTSILLLVTMCIVPWLVLRKLIRVAPKARVLLAAVVALCYVFVLAVSCELRSPLVASCPYLVFAPAIVVGIALFLYDAFVSNCFLLRGVRPSEWDLVIAKVIAIGCALVTLAVIAPSEGVGVSITPTFLSPLMGGACMCVAYLVIPAIVAESLSPGEEHQHLPSAVTNTAKGGVMQNGMATTIVVSLVGSVLIETLTKVCMFTDNSISMLELLIALVGILAGALFPLKINSRFLEDSIRQDGCKDDESGVELISRHLQRQALCVMLCTFPWSLSILCKAKFLEVMPEEQYMKERLMQEYLFNMSLTSACTLFSEIGIGKATPVKELTSVAHEAIAVVRQNTTSSECSSETSDISR